VRIRRLFVVSLLALLAAGAASGEDRIERISDPRSVGVAKAVKELVYRDGALAESISYDADGALQKEVFFDSSSLPVQTRSYIRHDGRLERVEYEDASGGLVGSLSYRYDRDGCLLGVDSDGDLGAISVGMVSTEAIPEASWVSGETTTVLGYDDSGRVETAQTMEDGAVVSVESRRYGDTGLPASVRTEDKASGLVTELLYGKDGRVSSRIEAPLKGQQSRTDYRYDDSGRLTEEILLRAGHRSVKALAYSKDGTLIREETRMDGELLLIVDHIGDGRVDELYDDGRLFVKATYAGGRKVKDEFYIDGVLSRTREY